MPETFGGSADLTGSNNTLTSDMGVFSPENRKGRYMYYGVREHGMAAAMNGMALHGGTRAYGGTFMCFTDYARGSMRLSALMGVPVTYVMTHDSIGLGEDGPTHQPVEHLAMQGLPTLRLEHTTRNEVSKGAYVLAEAVAKRQAILMATGSEVAVAMEAKALLEADGIGCRVVSMPCWELFEEQDEKYRRKVLPAGPVRVAVEAGIRFGWDRWLFGERGRREKSGFVGMHGFGASAPAGELYEHFGITAQATAAKVRELLS